MIPDEILQATPALTTQCILSGFRGSIAHGTYQPSQEPTSVDDKDVMAICVPPEDYYLGLKTFHRRGTQEIKYHEWDIVIYEARKFLSLLENGNPNVLALLWLEPQHYLCITPAGKLILEARQLFVGKHVYHSFVGYAHGQLRRMTHCAHEGYMGEKRKQLVQQFGYDCKNAGHLIRLLRMGIEFLTDGVLHVQRVDAQQLLAIKRGEWTLEQVQQEADRLFTLAQEAFIRSPLPAQPDHDSVNELAVQVIRQAWRSQEACLS